VDFKNIVAAKYVLENVERVFRGPLHFRQGGWCYTGRPPRWCVRHELIETPFPPERVLAVYLDLNMRVYEFRAEKASPDDPLSPIDWQNRYGGLTWKKTSTTS
jgi:hypothetical protein